MKSVKEKIEKPKALYEFVEHYPDVIPSLKAAYDRYEKSIKQGLLDLKKDKKRKP